MTKQEYQDKLKVLFAQDKWDEAAKLRSEVMSEGLEDDTITTYRDAPKTKVHQSNVTHYFYDVNGKKYKPISHPSITVPAPKPSKVKMPSLADSLVNLKDRNLPTTEVDINLLTDAVSRLNVYMLDDTISTEAQNLAIKDFLSPLRSSFLKFTGNFPKPLNDVALDD